MPIPFKQVLEIVSNPSCWDLDQIKQERKSREPSQPLAGM